MNNLPGIRHLARAYAAKTAIGRATTVATVATRRLSKIAVHSSAENPNTAVSFSSYAPQETLRLISES